MAYRIVYSKDRKIPPRYGKILGFQTTTGLFLLATVVLVANYWDAGTEVMRLVLGQTGGLQVSGLAEAWMTGEGLYEALALFCRSVIYGAA